MNLGWIRLYRQIRDHPRRKDPGWISVWIEIMLRATHQPVEMEFAGRIIVLKPGQLIASRKSIADSCGVSESKTERVLAWMESEQQIEQQGSNRSRLITILNWDKYQPIGQQNEQPPDNKRTTNGQPSDTNKNDKNERIDSLSEIPRPPTIEEVILHGDKIGVSRQQAENFFHYNEKAAWLDANQNPIRNWQSGLILWRNRNQEREYKERHNANNSKFSKPSVDRNKGTFNEGKASQY